MIKRFSDKVREYIFNRSGHVCEIKGPGCTLNQGLAVHHIKANSKTNRSQFGNELIQSSWNAVLTCAHCHREYYYEFFEFRSKLIYIK